MVAPLDAVERPAGDTVAPLDAVEKPAGDTVAPLDAVEKPAGDTVAPLDIVEDTFPMIYVHLCLAELYSNLSKHLHDLTVSLRQSTGTTKRHYCTHDLERRNLSVVVHSNPQTVALPWSAACERIGLLSENGIRHWPHDCRQLQTAAELFRMLPVWTVGHLREELGTISAATCKDIAFQLCEMLPVVSIVQRRERRDGIGKTLDNSS